MHSISQRIAQVALSLLSLSAAIQALAVERRATVCNGHAEFCNRSYGNITFVGAHDSYAVGTNNIATNQDYNVTQQLTDGVRMLQMQAHNNSGTINLCHTSCSLYNGGTLQDYLTSVKTWMQANTNDVVTLLIVNEDDLPVSQFGAIFQAAGMDTLSYTPPAAVVPATQWPTLGSLIDNGTRLVTFMDAEADFTSVPYIINEFTNVWETEFDVTDTTFDCNVNRTKGDPSTEMYLINHFLDQLVFGQPAPDVSQANVTNGVSGVGSLGQQVATCQASQGRNPNFMLVDFYEYGGGSVFQVAATANGVTYSPTTPIATPKSQNGSPSSPTGSGSTSANSGMPGFQIGDRTWVTMLVLVGSVLLGASSVF